MPTVFEGRTRPSGRCFERFQCNRSHPLDGTRSSGRLVQMPSNGRRKGVLACGRPQFQKKVSVRAVAFRCCCAVCSTAFHKCVALVRFFAPIAGFHGAQISIDVCRIFQIQEFSLYAKALGHGNNVEILASAGRLFSLRENDKCKQSCKKQKRQNYEGRHLGAFGNHGFNPLVQNSGC